MIIIELIYNLAVLISISIFAGFIESRWKRSTLPGAIAQGLLFGSVTIIGMMNPFVFVPGVIFDGRSVVLSLCGMFFGPLSVSIAAIMSIIYRITIGGAGVYMGILVIISSTLIGIAAYYYRHKRMMVPSVLFLYVVGLIVHAFMIGFMLLLPSTLRIDTIKTISITVLGIYPVAMILVGKMLYGQEERATLLRRIIQNEKDSSTTLMSIGDGVIATDINGKITRMNKMAEKLTGWKYVDASGLSLNEVFKTFDIKTGEPLINPVQRILESNFVSGISENSLLVDRYKSEYYISDSASPILDAKGRIQGAILVFSDITGQVVAEKELASERNLLRTVIDSMPFSVYVKDKKFKKLLVNKRELEFINHTEEEVIGKDDYDLYPYELAQKFIDDDFQVVEKGISLIEKKEYLPFTPEKYRWLSTTKIPWKDEDGNIIGLVGFGIDITDKIENEEKIRKFSESMIQSPTAIIITNREGVIEYTNPRFEEMTGYKEADVIGKVARILKGKNITAGERTEIWETILSGKKWKGEYYSKRKTNDFYWESVMISPIFDNTHEITNFIIIIEDITGRKNLISELITTKEKAVESDNLKTAFLANMSHEIRTPMNGILGFTELLKDPDIKPDEQQLYLKLIEQSGQRLLGLINDIIDISKIEAGQLVLSFEDVNINELIDLQYQFFKAEAETKKLTLKCFKGLPPEHAIVRTDVNRVSQVLINLIKNSLKFTQKGKIEFGYILSGNMIEFSVSDDGIGISDEMREKIFERFHQGDLILNRRYEGAGLGLSISKALVEMLGGRIWVEKKETQGSVFKFTIPYKQ